MWLQVGETMKAAWHVKQRLAGVTGLVMQHRKRLEISWGSRRTIATVRAWFISEVAPGEGASAVGPCRS